MKRTIVTYSSTVPIVTPEGIPSDVFNFWIRQVTDRGLYIGTGSPEGVLEAQQGAEYLDETGIAGAVKYIKQVSAIAGDRTKGWVAI